jgi:large subunit ribosomal protein L22
MTIKRFKPRARGRATRIRKRTCHITVIVSPIPPAELARRQARDAARDASGVRRTRTPSQDRAARVARSRATTDEATATDEVTETPTDEVVAETTDEASEAEATEVEETTEAPEAAEVTDDTTEAEPADEPEAAAAEEDE